MAKKKQLTKLPAKKASGRPAASKMTEAEQEIEHRRIGELASPVAGVVSLRHIFMDDCFARRTADGFSESSEVKVGLKITDAEIGEPETRDKFFIRLKFSINVRSEDGEDGDQPVVELMAQFVILYDLANHDGISVENLKAFAQTSGVFSVWPYLREFVHSSSLRLAVPPIILPTKRM